MTRPALPAAPRIAPVDPASATPEQRRFLDSLESNLARRNILRTFARFTDLSRAGALAGMQIENPGKGLEFVPYLLGRRRVEAFAGDPPAVQATGGTDFGWRITWFGIAAGGPCRCGGKT